MQAVRQIQQVKNGLITVQLPADFPTDEVEVIVLPVQSIHNETEKSDDEDEGILAIQDFLTIDTSHFSPQQLVAYEQSSDKLRKWLETREGRLIGAFEGLVEIADDFDEADEIEKLFYADNIEPELQ